MVLEVLDLDQGHCEQIKAVCRGIGDNTFFLANTVGIGLGIQFPCADALATYKSKPEIVPPYVWEFCSRLFMREHNRALSFVSCAYVTLQESPVRDSVLIVGNNDGDSEVWAEDDFKEYIDSRLEIPRSRYDFRPKCLEDGEIYGLDVDADADADDYGHYNVWFVRLDDIKNLYSKRKAFSMLAAGQFETAPSLR